MLLPRLHSQALRRKFKRNIHLPPPAPVFCFVLHCHYQNH